MKSGLFLGSLLQHHPRVKKLGARGLFLEDEHPYPA